MELWDAILLCNGVLGILATYYYAKQKGEILVGDLVGIFLIIIFGSFTFWMYFYDEYSVPIHKGWDSLKHIGKKPLWRSKSTIAKEVLFGSNKDE